MVPRSSAANSRSCWPSTAPDCSSSSGEPTGSSAGAPAGASATGSGQRCSSRRGVVFSAAAGHRSEAWYVATGFEKHRVFDHGLWSLAAMIIGLAVLPVVATVAAFASVSFGHRRRSRFRHRRSLGVRRVRRIRRGQRRVLSTVFSLLIVERNVIYLVPIVFAATAAVLRGRSRPPRARGRLRSSPCSSSCKPSSGSTSIPTSRRPASRSERSRTGTSSGTPPRRARSHRRGAGLRRDPRGALVRPLADDRARDRDRRRLRGDRLGADDGDLRRSRPQRLLRADAPDLAETRRLGRPGDGRRADAVPRPAAREGHEPDLAARVLELRDRQDLEPRRHGAAPVALARPRRSRRHDEPGPGCELGRYGQRRRGGGQESRRAAQGDAALADRAAGPLPEHANRRLSRTGG